MDVGLELMGRLVGDRGAIWSRARGPLSKS